MEVGSRANRRVNKQQKQNLRSKELSINKYTVFCGHIDDEITRPS